MPVFSHPGPVGRSRSSTYTTSSSGGDTPPLSEGSQSSIDLSQLNVLLSNATHPMSMATRTRTRRYGHGVRPLSAHTISSGSSSRSHNQNCYLAFTPGTPYACIRAPADSCRPKRQLPVNCAISGDPETIFAAGCRAEARECVRAGTCGKVSCRVQCAQNGTRVDEAKYGQIVNGSEGECHWTRVGYVVCHFSSVESVVCSMFISTDRRKILDSVDLDLVVVRRLLHSTGSFGFESHTLKSFSPYAMHMVYANLFITYATPMIKLCNPHNFVQHAALDDATANEFENPRPKHDAYLAPQVVFSLLLLTFPFPLVLLYFSNLNLFFLLLLPTPLWSRLCVCISWSYIGLLPLVCVKS